MEVESAVRETKLNDGELNPALAEDIGLRVQRIVFGNGSVTTRLFRYCVACGRSLSLSDGERCSHVATDRRRSQPPAGRSRKKNEFWGNLGGGRKALACVADVMAREAVCVCEDVSVGSLITLLQDCGCGGIPVVSAEGRLIGFVSMSDIAQELYDRGGVVEEPRKTVPTKDEWLAEELAYGFHVDALDQMTVGEIMSHVAFAIPESSPVLRAAALMAFEGVHRLPVVSDQQSVIGVISALDVLRWLGAQDRPSWPAPAFTENKPRSRSARVPKT